MTAFTMPSWFGADGFSLSLYTVQRTFSSPEGGSEQVIDRLSDRWLATLSASPRTFAEAAALEAFIASLRGMTNTLAIYHLLRPQPRGSMRGAPVVAAPLFRGDPNIQVTTTAGATLLAGDLVGCSGLLFQVAQDCVADGAGLMNILTVNRSRVAAASGTAVVWDKPSAPFRMTSKPVVDFIPGYAQGVAFDFVEAVG